jgi:hypothetical protein
MLVVEANVCLLLPQRDVNHDKPAHDAVPYGAAHSSAEALLSASRGALVVIARQTPNARKPFTRLPAR